MYKCKNCGHLFEDGEAKRWKEPHGEDLVGCPICECDFEEIKPCVLCGSYDHDIDTDYCEICKIYVKNRFKNLVEKNFTEEERELLNELYDGERI